MCFLLSPGASFISGATLRVDAGGSLYTNMWNVPSKLVILIFPFDCCLSEMVLDVYYVGHNRLVLYFCNNFLSEYDNFLQYA